VIDERAQARTAIGWLDDAGVRFDASVVEQARLLLNSRMRMMQALVLEGFRVERLFSAARTCTHVGTPMPFEPWSAGSDRDVTSNRDD
jgi:hypothetical protein